MGQKVKGAAVRTRTQFYEHGERSSKFVHGLEKSKDGNKNITSLVNSNGDRIYGIDKVLEEETLFYSEIYSSKTPREHVDPDIWKEFFCENTHNKVLENSFAHLERDLTENEIHQALKESDNNKSPGSDGIPVDFYKVFWPKIKPFLVRSYKRSLELGSLSITQRQGVISLIPKKSKDPLYLDNWRPISILNHDQKVLTKAMATRIKSVIDLTIHPDQIGFIGGRFIGENILNVTSISEHLSQSGGKGKAILLDFAKAFDSIEWYTIDAALIEHGFGPKFRSWIRCIQCRPESCVINAGHFSSFFKVTRGERQGCLLSPYLFILTIEVLANKIRNDKNIDD